MLFVRAHRLSNLSVAIVDLLRSIMRPVKSQRDGVLRKPSSLKKKPKLKKPKLKHESVKAKHESVKHESVKAKPKLKKPKLKQQPADDHENKKKTVW